jgi:hypothetical protein
MSTYPFIIWTYRHNDIGLKLLYDMADEVVDSGKQKVVI